ncbi:DAK2 domain-containing protein [Deinococcus sp.]|uniref:DAK2 domain-containing protein n=1 Tax=Deinococcus sp. TaxID=47478 RepID=UPI002869C42D|nr:DAK2 domain-containing protein [Deinococcus sp.]
MSDPVSTHITGADIDAALRRAAGRLLELRDHLNALDAEVGDGDSGLTAEKGANAMLAYLDATPPGEDLGKWLAGAGMAYNRAAPSTMGALMATAFMRAGKTVMGQSTLSVQQLAGMLTAADQGLQERGKVKPGDKTIVDAVHPAAEAFMAAAQAGQPLDACAQTALDAARAGRDAAIALRGQVGRSNWVGERTEGRADPGTVLFVSALEAVMQATPSETGSTLG